MSKERPATGSIGAPGNRPWQMNVLSNPTNKARNLHVLAGLDIAGAAAAAYYWRQQRDVEAQQAAAVEKYGRHGEKVQGQYGVDFEKTTEKVKGRFPGAPTTETNAPGGHAGGAQR
jgi:hypothetical protein